MVLSRIARMARLKSARIISFLFGFHHYGAPFNPRIANHSDLYQVVGHKSIKLCRIIQDLKLHGKP
jgi:hypothetical protein